MTTSRQVLDQVLAGRDVTPDQLDEMLRDRLAEDLYLDYKRGALLAKPKRERNEDMLRMISGFANADGGWG